MEKEKKKFKLSNSLSLQIGLIYTLLAAINITFFSVMIFENQTELIKDKFIIESNMLAIKLANELETEIVTKKYEIDTNTLKTIADSSSGSVNFFSIIEKKDLPNPEVKNPNTPPEVGYDILYSYDRSGISKSTIDEKFLKNLNKFQNTEVSKLQYIKEVDTEDLKIKLLMPFKTKDDFSIKLMFNIKGKPEDSIKPAKSIFIYTFIDLKTIEDLKRKLWLQITTSLIWGVVFHALFGVYVYRIIFIRVGKLKNASDQMSTGDLKTRVSWNFKRGDELDDLGASFNNMATTIESNVLKIEQHVKKMEEDAAVIQKLNAEINQELEIGKEVQQLFLSKKAKYKQYKIAISYRPMREVSGDIYHFYKIPEHKNSPRSYSAFFFADASGHGVSAALVTVVMIMSLENIVKQSCHPSFVINKLSEVMGNTLQASFFATSVFFLLNDKGDVYVSNAGHNAPIIYRPSTGEMRFIHSSGPPLGMADGFMYKTERIKTQPGDKIFIYSDGLVESPNDKEEMFSEQRVIDLINANIHKENQEVLDILAKELDQFKSEYRDDVSMILLEMP